MCVGNCTGWGQGMTKTPRAGKGGRPGRGVGTWSDDNGWMNFPTMVDRWDNSGIERPDQRRAASVIGARATFRRVRAHQGERSD